MRMGVRLGMDSVQLAAGQCQALTRTARRHLGQQGLALFDVVHGFLDLAGAGQGPGEAGAL